ncbi:MAG TPA: PIN domain-containing protein [Polyangiaceae bacterium]|nr:PIN domain-containing protein [Polyangiaceae bacterium]
MSALVVDTSVWVDFFRGVPLVPLEDALHDGLVVLAPLVAAELLSAPLSKSERRSLVAFVRDLPLHPASLDHWLAVGTLRAQSLKKGLSVSTPDAHIAECAIEANALLWSSDAIFRKLAKVSSLRLFDN